jgi:hypothetical protein
MTVGRDRVEYPGKVVTITTDLTVTKAILNSLCSTKGALYINMDIKNNYLDTSLERYEYVRIPVSMLPDDIMNEYNLHALVHNGYIYIEVCKRMYGLPQVGLLANIFLAKRFIKHAEVAPTHFFLVVDNFGVMYVVREHVEHVKAALEENYEISTDWAGGLYFVIKLQWDYEACNVDLSMAGYIAAVLYIFQYPLQSAHNTHHTSSSQ